MWDYCMYLLDIYLVFYFRMKWCRDQFRLKGRSRASSRKKQDGGDVDGYLVSRRTLVTDVECGFSGQLECGLYGRANPKRDTESGNKMADKYRVGKQKQNGESYGPNLRWPNTSKVLTNPLEILHCKSFHSFFYWSCRDIFESYIGRDVLTFNHTWIGGFHPG